MQKLARTHTALAGLILAASIALACTDEMPTEVASIRRSTQRAQILVPCTASLLTKTVTCGNEVLPGVSLKGVSGDLIGDQNRFVKLTSSNVSYNSGTGIFQFDVTVQNLMNEAIGTPGEGIADPDGIQVFFNSGPTVTGGAGVISVANADGSGTFTGANQPYFAYHEILATNAVSAAHTWQLSMPPTVTTFGFNLLIETDTEIKLVINEMLVNPGGTISDANGEWIELYNAGSRPVQLQNLVIADSAASGRRPYALIASDILVQPGAYVTLGNTTNTTNNGGVPVDYAYGASMAFANSLDAFKISRVYGTDTVTIDRTQYANASVSAQNGISRELKNPSLDNSNMDGSNWADASVTSVYGEGGRGTPKAQNSGFAAFASWSLPINESSFHTTRMRR